MKRSVLLVLLSALLLVGLGFSLSRLTPGSQPPAEAAPPSPAVATAAVEPEADEISVPTPEPLPEPTPEPSPKTWTVTEYKSEEAERFLWDCLSRYSPNDCVTAGVLAMFWRESSLRSDATAHWAESLNVTGVDYPVVFTAEIDSGLADGSTREQFVETVHYAVGGYGLGQWYSHEMLTALYDFAQSWGTSIADAEMQCAFTIENMQSHGYEEMWNELRDIRDPLRAGWLVAVCYDGTHSGSDVIAKWAEYLYDKYAKNK